VILQVADSRPWYFLLHESEDYEDQLDCLSAIAESPEENRSLITTKKYHTGWVQNIHCLFTAISGGKSRYRERCSFCSHSCVGDKWCGAILGFECD